MGGRRAVVFDLLLVGGLVAISVSLVLGPLGSPGNVGLDLVLVVGHVAPLWFRRRAPLGVLAAMTVTGLASPLIGLPAVALGPGILVAVAEVGARCEPRTGRRAVGAVTVAMVAVTVSNGMGADTAVTNVLAFGVAWWLGDRSRRAAQDTERERAAAGEAVRQAAAAERVRIARELHDVVAHAMSVIAVQAGTGRFVMDESPEVARAALVSIEEASRDALQEMRRLLSILRDEEEGEAGLLPSPGLGDLGGLVEGTRQGGVDVDLVVEGSCRPLPAGVELCAYRVVQEALTNVRKHALARRASVVVRYAPSTVELEVTDDGIGARGPSVGGHGLVGMRERVALYGGVLDASPRPEGGYRVHATIPSSAAP